MAVAEPTRASVTEIPEPQADPQAIYWRILRRDPAFKCATAIIVLLILVTALAGFLAPYSPDQKFAERAYLPPQSVHFRSASGFSLRPFVYGVTGGPQTPSRRFRVDRERRYSIYLFEHGHLFGVRADDGHGLFLLGTDSEGRDLFSRILYGGRAALLIAFGAMLISLGSGITVAWLSALGARRLQALMHAFSELLGSLPVPLVWMVLAAAIPAATVPSTVLPILMLILAILGWSQVERTLHRQIEQVGSRASVTAAHLMGATTRQILGRHVQPALYHGILLAAASTVAAMLSAESLLSCFGVGVPEPLYSWGSLLGSARSIESLRDYPWLMCPGIPLVLALVCLQVMQGSLQRAGQRLTDLFAIRL